MHLGVTQAGRLGHPSIRKGHVLVRGQFSTRSSGTHADLVGVGLEIMLSSMLVATARMKWGNAALLST